MPEEYTEPEVSPADVRELVRAAREARVDLNFCMRDTSPVFHRLSKALLPFEAVKDRD